MDGYIGIVEVCQQIVDPPDPAAPQLFEFAEKCGRGADGFDVAAS